jgi:hypothetical protein
LCVIVPQRDNFSKITLNMSFDFGVDENAEARAEMQAEIDTLKEQAEKAREERLLMMKLLFLMLKPSVEGSEEHKVYEDRKMCLLDELLETWTKDDALSTLMKSPLIKDQWSYFEDWLEFGTYNNPSWYACLKEKKEECLKRFMVDLRKDMAEKAEKEEGGGGGDH